MAPDSDYKKEMDEMTVNMKKDDGKFPNINYMNGIIHRNERPRNSMQKLKNVREIDQKERTQVGYVYGSSSIKPDSSFHASNALLLQSVDTFRSPKDFPKLDFNSEKTRNKRNVGVRKSTGTLHRDGENFGKRQFKTLANVRSSYEEVKLPKKKNSIAAISTEAKE